MASVIIGIAGGTGSGKTTLTRQLKKQFSEKVSVINHDDYYKRHDSLTLEERKKINYDSPDAFDTDIMVEDLKALKNGKTVHCPVYDYSVHNRTNRTQTVEPSDVIIVEGILVFQSKALRELMDIKIFVDTDADERLIRRILRDCGERGRSIDQSAPSTAKQSSQCMKNMLNRAKNLRTSLLLAEETTLLLLI